MDITPLLSPIEGDSPVGIYLKSDRSRYRGARNAFNAAQSSFRRLLETPEAMQDEERIKENRKNWQELKTTCEDILSTHSKDIEITCWWIACSPFETDPLAALEQSLQLLKCLLDDFWPDIHPITPEIKLKGDSEEDRANERVALQLRPLIQLVGESNGSGLLYMPLQLISLVGEINLGDYISAKKNSSVADLQNQARNIFVSERGQIEQKIMHLGAIQETITQLDCFISEQCRVHYCGVISCRFLMHIITEALEAIRFLVGSKFTRWPLDQAPNETAIESKLDTPEDSEEQSNLSTGGGSQLTNQIHNRNQAFGQLRIIAEYFRSQEPHSPISFMIEKTIHWGYLSFPELIAELIQGNDDVISQVGLLTGMNELPAPPEFETTDEAPLHSSDDNSSSSSTSDW